MRSLAVMTLAALIALASAASAGAHVVIDRDGSVLTLTASNNCAPTPCPSTLVATTPETGILEFRDETSNGGIFWGPCTPLTETRTRCDTGGITRVEVTFDRNDDSAAMGTAIPVNVKGALGDDEITGGFGADLLEGGGGDDAIVGGAGSDTVAGDAGNDLIDVRDGGPDTVDCGDGVDAVTADLSDPASPPGCEVVTVQDAPPPDPPPDTPPDTTITKSPPRKSDRDHAAFRFRASEPGSTFECSRDASPYRPCDSPKRFGGLRPGRHTFGVRATDAAGHTDPTTARYRWRVME